MPGRDPVIMTACFRPSATGLGGRVVRGAAWMGALAVLRTVLTVGSTAVLARLLTPADYGLVAMATVVTELAAMLCTFGLPAIIVQMPRLTRLDLDSAFWFSVMLGAAAVAAIVAGSSFAAGLFREARLTPILWAMSSMILLDEVSAVHLSIANRLLLFRFEFIWQVASLAVRIVVSIGLAVAGFGVWSLVWGSVAARTIQFALLWYLIPYLPRARFNLRFLRRNWRAGGSYFGSGALFFLGSKVDTAVAGRMFGVTQLGFYQTAFALPEELRGRIALTVQKVLFPAYALIQSDHSRFQSTVLQSLRLLATIVVPMGVGMAVLADPIVRVLYGDQWLPVVPLLRIVAAVGIVRALQAVLADIYKAKGRPDLDFKIGLGLGPFLLLAVLAGSLWGTAGVAGGVLVFNIALLASTYRALRLIDLGLFNVFRALFPAIAASAFMGGGLLILDALHAVAASAVSLALIASVATGMLLYFIPLLLLSRRTVDDLWSVGRVLLARR